MKLSVITICKNEEKRIRKTIGSVLCQKYVNFEYIVIDGNSSDDTCNIVKEFGTRVSLYIQTGSGISDAFNKGVEVSTGDYICFLNSGDCFLYETVLDDVYEKIRTSYSDIVLFNTVDSNEKVWIRSEQSALDWWERGLVPHQSTFVKREVFYKVGFFNRMYKVRMDYDFFLKCNEVGCSYSCSLKCIVRYDSNGISSVDRDHFIREGLAIKLLHDQGILESDYDALLSISCEGENGVFNRMTQMQKQRSKLESYILCLERYIRLLQQGYSILYKLQTDGIRDVLIYGWGDLGKLIARELESKGLRIIAIADQDMDDPKRRVYRLQEEWPESDAVIISVMGEVSNIKSAIEKKTNKRIYCLADLFSIEAMV